MYSYVNTSQITMRSDISKTVSLISTLFNFLLLLHPCNLVVITDVGLNIAVIMHMKKLSSSHKQICSVINMKDISP